MAEANPIAYSPVTAPLKLALGGVRKPVDQLSDSRDEVVISPKGREAKPTNPSLALEIDGILEKLGQGNVAQEYVAPPPMYYFDHLIGRNVSQFSLIQGLGSGGMGEVYLAKDQSTGDLVALKLFNPSLSKVDQWLASEVRGLEYAAGVANMIQGIDSGSIGNLKYVVTQYVEGSTVSSLMEANRGRLSVPQAMEITRSALYGLQGLHEKEAVHRDIKPTNIQIHSGTRANVTILDAGLVEHFTNTETDLAFGTPNYMAPEATYGQKLDGRADVFSMGVTAYEMMTGRVPLHVPEGSKFLDYHDLPPQAFENLPPIVRSRIMPGMLAIDRDLRSPVPDLLEEIDTYLHMEELSHASFAKSVGAGIKAAAAAGAPMAGTLIYFCSPEMNVGFEALVNDWFPPEQGYKALRSDRAGMEGMFVYTEKNQSEALKGKEAAISEATRSYFVNATAKELSTAEGANPERLFDRSSKLVRAGKEAVVGTVKVINHEAADASVDKADGSKQTAAEKKNIRPQKPSPTTKLTVSTKADSAAAAEIPEPQKAAVLALAALWGRELAEQINGQLATLDQDKLGGLERDLQGKIRGLSNQKFVDIMREAGLSDTEALKIKVQLDSFEFKQYKTGFVAMASGLLSMTAVSYLISKVSPDMNPGLHFAVVMLGGHYTNIGVKALAGKIRNKTFMLGVRELAGNVRNGRIIIKGLSGSALAALKVPLLTAGKAAGLLGKGVWAGVKATHGMGLGTLTAAGWKYIMDGMGVKNVYVREGGAMAAFLAPDVAKLSARYLVTVKGFKTLSQLMVKGAVGTAAKAANVVGWAAFAADLTIGGIEHGMIKDAYTRSVIARAKEAWKDAQDGFFSIAGTMALDGLIGSFADAMVPENYLDKVKAQDEQAITAFMEELGKGVFLANVTGGSSEEINTLIADHIKAFVATPDGKETFEGMQALLKIKYGGSQNLTVCQKLISELDVSSSDKIVVTDQLSSALRTGSTFAGTYVQAQLRKAATVVKEIPLS